MNEKDLSSLSYKELQSLAVKYRVPGNIKKHLLIQVLEAVKIGNNDEVEKILRDLHHARKKKRLKKQKRNNIGGNSSPMYSPTYAMSEDCYHPQQQMPCHWVGAEEEVSNRDDVPIKVPDYDEFANLLLRRIQQDYQTYAINDNVQVSSIVDLRMGAGSSAHEPIFFDANNVKSNTIMETDSHTRALTVGKNQIVADTKGNNEQKLALLKKMLEAPAGANLGAIASPEKQGSYGKWKSKNYPSCNNNQDDSDTMTADSDVDNEDNWEAGNNIISGGNYYHSLMNNNNRITSRGNQSSQEKTFQTTENLLADGVNRFEFTYPISDVQANCQKWIASNSFVNTDTNYLEQFTENSRGFYPIYYDETSDNSTVTRPINLERKNTYNENNNNLIYDVNQAIIQEQISQQYYQNNLTNESIDPTNSYYSQQIAKGFGDTSQSFLTHGSYGNTDTIHNVYQNTIANQELHNSQFHTFNNKEENCIQSSVNNGVQYNAGYYQQYNHQNNQSNGNFHYPENPNYQEINQTSHHPYHHEQQQSMIVAETPEIGNRKNNSAETLQSTLNGALDPFWPRWPINGTLTSGMQLEPILNLRHSNVDVDKAKIHQTSCVYSCSTPIITHRTNVTSCTLFPGEKRLIAERRHFFTPNSLVYNDASTGKVMKIISKIRIKAETSSILEGYCSSRSSDPTPLDYIIVRMMVTDDSGCSVESLPNTYYPSEFPPNMYCPVESLTNTSSPDRFDHNRDDNEDDLW